MSMVEGRYIPLPVFREGLGVGFSVRQSTCPKKRTTPNPSSKGWRGIL